MLRTVCCCCVAPRREFFQLAEGDCGATACGGDWFTRHARNLRPTEGESRYFVYTRWESEEHFQAWMASQDFARGHASGQADGNKPAGADAPRQPIAQGADLMSFEVVEHVVKGA